MQITTMGSNAIWKKKDKKKNKKNKKKTIT